MRGATRNRRPQREVPGFDPRRRGRRRRARGASQWPLEPAQSTMSNYERFLFANDEALASDVAGRWLTKFAERERANAPLNVALSGGRIASKFFTAVAQRARAGPISLAAVHFFWADERCVPPSDPQSNFGLARTTLLDPMGIQPDKIHRLRGEISPDRAAVEAEAEICRLVPIDAVG